MINYFVLLIPDGDDPPDLPWAADCTPSSPRVARWQRLDNHVEGDGQLMGPSLYALVTLNRDPQTVIDAFHLWSQQREAAPPRRDGTKRWDQEAVLLLQRYGRSQAEVCSSLAAPRLLAALRDPGRGGLLS